MPTPEKWIVLDEHGSVQGRIKSPWFSGAVHLAEQFWPELQTRIIRWRDATEVQRYLARQFPFFTTETHERAMSGREKQRSISIADAAKKLQQRFMRAGGTN